MATTEPEITARVVARLQDLLPHLALRKIEAEVASVLSAFADSRVRTFLPILVERQALERLRGLAERDAADPPPDQDGAVAARDVDDRSGGTIRSRAFDSA